MADDAPWRTDYGESLWAVWNEVARDGDDVLLVRARTEQEAVEHAVQDMRVRDLVNGGGVMHVALMGRTSAWVARVKDRKIIVDPQEPRDE